MAFLYHRVPHGLEGETLYPLNQLRHQFPNAYRRHAEKYRDRAWLVRRSIPSLQVRWGDALQLTAIQPSVMRKAMEAAGGVFGGEFFVIDPASLDPLFTTVFTYTEDTYVEDAEFNPRQFVPYAAATVGGYGLIGKATRDHYAAFRSAGREPFPYYRTAHILYAGLIDTARLDRVKV